MCAELKKLTNAIKRTVKLLLIKGEKIDVVSKLTYPLLKC